jgi:transcriptional regulator with XRE-family HTH domain
MSLSKELLEELYNQQKLSMAEIAERLGCSQNKVAYWMVKHEIPRRDISEAIYRWHNPDGDPFEVQALSSEDERALFYLAVALYIGEGKKRGHDVSLSNTDPRVIRIFLRFLRKICGVDESKVWAWINIFDDAGLEEAQRYWEESTGLLSSQFYKPVVRPQKGGSYSNLSEHGTLTVGVSNTNLRDIVLNWCEEYLNKYS